MRALRSWLVVVAACSPAAGENVAFSPPPSTPHPDGTVRLARESRPYVATEKVALGAASPVVMAPARIAFRDGAVSQVNLPIAGRVTAVHVNTGDRVKAGDPLVTITSPDAAAAGHVVSIGSALTGALRTAPVYIAFDAAGAAPAAGDPAVRAGMFARAVIKAPAGQTIVLPAEAVLLEDGKTYVVYVKVGDDRFAARKVEVGRSIDGRVEVVRGVAPGDEVVTRGALLLDGAAEQLL